MPEILETRIAPAVLADLIQFPNAAEATEVIATDSAGNIFVAGIFFGNLVLVPGTDGISVTTSDPAGDVYVAKLKPDGSPLWLSSWGGPGPETVQAIATEASGDVFVTGSFDSTGAGFGGSGSAFTAPQTPELFVIKLDKLTGGGVTAFDGDGMLQFGALSGFARGSDIVTDVNGFIIVGGTFQGNGAGINHSTGPNVNSDAVDAVLLRLDATSGAPDDSFGNGGMLVVNLSSATDDFLFRVAVDSSGDIYAGVRTFAPVTGVPPADGVVKLLGDTGLLDTSFNTGGPLGLATGALEADFSLDDNIVIAAVADASGVRVSRFDPSGNLDTGFGFVFLDVNATEITVRVDPASRIYVGGATAEKNFLARLRENGSIDTTFGPNGIAEFGSHGSSLQFDAAFALDNDGYLVFRDTFTGKPDLDPTPGVKKLAARNKLPPGMADGFIARVDLDGFASGTPVKVFANPNSVGITQELIVTLSGPGRIRVTDARSETGSRIETIEFMDTTLSSTLTVSGRFLDESQQIDRIFTTQPNQHIGAIILDPLFIIGDGVNDLIPDLLVTGRVDKLVLGDLSANAYIKLGQDLPYNLPGNKQPDTYNNRPSLKVRNVLDDGVIIENTGDGTLGGVGGGGFGDIVFNSWAFPGVLRTTQSIGNLTIKTGDFLGVLEIDKFHVGQGTTANTGTMNVQEGSWGSSGSEIEGTMGGFNAEAFLAGASITAGSIGGMNVGGEFAGTLTLTDADANKLPTFTVATDFTGIVVSLAPLKKVKVKGDFKGSLTAPSIAGLTALSFIGDTTGDATGDADKLNITATLGLLGKVKTKSGVVRNYEFTAPNAPFSGLKVGVISPVGSLAGIENVRIKAASIGPISVKLAASGNAPVMDLTGIKNSVFIATQAGGNIAGVKVSIAGGDGDAIGLDSSKFIASIIGNVSITTNAGNGASSTAHAVTASEFTAFQSLGSVKLAGKATKTQADSLQLWSGGTIGAVNVSASPAQFGSLENSIILAGQSLDFSGAVTPGDFLDVLQRSLLGPVKLSGSLRGSILAAGGDVAGVTIGGHLSDSGILAGASLGTNLAIGGGDDTFTRAVRIANVKVGGDFSNGVIAAGINPVNSVLGDGDDLLAPVTGPLPDTGSIGAVTLGGGVFVTTPPMLGYTSAILAGKIARIIASGQRPATDFAAPVVLDTAGNGADTGDVLIKLIAP